MKRSSSMMGMMMGGSSALRAEKETIIYIGGQAKFFRVETDFALVYRKPGKNAKCVMRVYLSLIIGDCLRLGDC